MLADQQKVIASVRLWLESIVIELNLCPFAKKELLDNRIRFVVSAANSEPSLLTALETELNYLNESKKTVETTLLILPNVLSDFGDYNQFLSYADELIFEIELEGIIQIASFHPDYQFAGTNVNDPENYTNRAPYPILHLLRETSLKKAIDNHLDTSTIPTRNIELMNALGQQKLMEMFKPLMVK